MRFAIFCLATLAFAISSETWATPCKYDEWTFDKETPEACVRTKGGLVGKVSQGAKLAVGCEAGKMFVELVPSKGFGPRQHRDGAMRERFDGGDRIKPGRIWLFDADKARLKDFTEVKDITQKLQDGGRKVVLSGGGGTEETYSFRFSLINSAFSIKRLKEVCKAG